MSDAPAPGGLVARLLDRADGRVTALRPSVRPTFAAEQTRDEPFLETTEETPAAPPAASPVVPASPAEVTLLGVGPAIRPEVVATNRVGEATEGHIVQECPGR